MRQDMQIVFQDPYSSLDPRHDGRGIVAEPLEVHGIGTRKGRTETVRRLLEVVGFNPNYTNRYPHEFSGASASGSASPAPRAQPEADHLRRARLRARRLHPGADPQSPQGPPAGLRAHVPVHLPRPRRRPHDVRRDRRHEPGQARRGRACRAGHTSPKDEYTRALFRRAGSDPRRQRERKAERARLKLEHTTDVGGGEPAA